MKDYISRDEAIEFVKSVISTMSVCVNKDEWIGMDSMKKRAISALLDVPQSDVRKNVHAHWIHGKEIAREYLGDACIGIHYDGWHCSNCGHNVDTPYKPKYDFCPKCGAIMDEEV